MCIGEHCKACGASVASGCAHSKAERHLRSGDPAFEPESDTTYSKAGSELEIPVAPARAPTKPLPPVTGSVTLYFNEGDDVAAFLELMARIIRTKRRITVIAE